MRMPLKVTLIVLGVCALLWILAPGPMFGPGMGFGPGSGWGHGFGHGCGHGFGPMFGMGPHSGGLLMILLGAALNGAVIWFAMRKADESKKEVPVQTKAQAQVQGESQDKPSAPAP